MRDFNGIVRCLPKECSYEIYEFIKTYPDAEKHLSDIQIRTDRPMTLSYKGKNFINFTKGKICCTKDEIDNTLRALCEDSVFAYSESMKNGFITLEGGFRIGVCGRAVCEGDKIVRVCDISSLSIRIPHKPYDTENELYSIIVRGRSISSALIFSPPGVGKTTLIRGLAQRMSSGENPFRVCVIDTRNEIIGSGEYPKGCIDVLYGYPKGKGIEIATRTFSPEVIFCDEIGTKQESEAITEAQNSGVPLIATAHADTYETLIKRPNISSLEKAGIFDYYIGISRIYGENSFTYRIFGNDGKEARF